MRLMSKMLVAALVVLSATTTWAADSDALWKIVHDGCVPDQLEHSDPKPCTLVDLSGGVQRGFVLLKDRRGDTQFLLMPTSKITGIEDPAILAPGATNYFAAAWAARTYVEQRAQRPLPREDISLAINSQYGRTQDQLHIHVDCIRADVRDALGQNLARIGMSWAPFGFTLAGDHYLAMRVTAGELGATNPFQLLAEGVPGARDHMGQWTLVVVGAKFADAPGFVLLSDQVNLTVGDRASGEKLQDHDCAVAKE
jgi:CDP-diacylglycerol pyrophosphatase